MRRLGADTTADFPFRAQQSLYDCGFACLRMMAAHFGTPEPDERLVDGRGPSTRVSLKLLAEVAGSMGLHPLGVRTTMQRLTASVPLPCIALWGGDHYVVVCQAHGDRVVVADPGLGLVEYAAAEFEAHWLRPDGHGILLLVERAAGTPGEGP